MQTQWRDNIFILKQFVFLQSTNHGNNQETQIKICVVSKQATLKTSTMYLSKTSTNQISNKLKNESDLFFNQGSSCWFHFPQIVVNFMCQSINFHRIDTHKNRSQSTASVEHVTYFECQSRLVWFLTFTRKVG